MNRRVIVALIGMFAVGVLIGVVVALSVGSSSDDDAPAPEAVDCAEAEAVVADANGRLAEITAGEGEQDATFFAAILTEQRTISYTMDVAPDCFSLAARASAEGLLDGIRALVAVADFSAGGSAPIDPVAPGGAPPVSEPGAAPGD